MNAMTTTAAAYHTTKRLSITLQAEVDSINAILNDTDNKWLSEHLSTLQYHLTVAKDTATKLKLGL